MTSLPDTLRAIVGADGVLEGSETAGYRGDVGLPNGGEIVCCVRPRTAEQTAQIVKVCSTTGIAVTPRGGGTGLSGGATPLPGRASVVILFERMCRMRALDPIGNAMTVEAGCTLHDARQAANDAGRILGLDHGGLSSQIGGNLSTNAGGNNVLRYGMARDQVLGLEVVLSSGQILSDLAPLPKNNSGYDLKQIFIGSEGTLGLITAACLKLRPKPVLRVTACVGLSNLDDVLSLFGRARDALAEALTAFEVMPRVGLEFQFGRANAAREPFATQTPWIVVLEAESASQYFDLPRAVDALLELAINDAIVLDGTIASNETQRQGIWALREGIPLAMIETPSLKSDTAVPIAAIPIFVQRANEAVSAIMPGCTAVPFGHVGDGNIHFNVLPPSSMSETEFIRRKPELAQVIDQITLALGGTISAEHGIGYLKREGLKEMKSRQCLNIMRALKELLDPLALLNPGKIL
jgi:FAD/FMN-containing dehydrogenase